jgi:hypothetical protein
VSRVRCRPLDNWSGPFTTDRRSAPYGASWQRTLTDLVRELDHLDARDVVIGIQAREDEIRIDGWPKGGRTIPPPVVLTFESRVGSLRFQCDRWNDYRDNLRAIGLTLQRLRLVDEGGVSRSGEQYRGWGALPPATAMPTTMTVEQAARVLGDAAGPQWGDLSQAYAPVVHDAWRAAAKKHHPDAGGDPATFRQITDARDVLVRSAA